MKTLIDFLSPRPAWTRRGLEVVWYAYLLATLIQLGFFVGVIYSASGAVSGGYHYRWFIRFCSLGAFRRIFLEMALNFLMKAGEETLTPRP
jgi:hypothetical protein